MDKKDLRKLRKNLPKGAIRQLAENFSVTENHIYKVLCGFRNNTEIIKAAYKMAIEHREELREAEKFVQSLN
jgi:hypothetical protein